MTKHYTDATNALYGDLVLPPAKAKRNKLSNPGSTTEVKEGILLMNWVRTQPQLDGLFFHIANERHVSPAAGHLLKQQGVLAGVSDFFLPLPIGDYHGFWLELKKDRTTGVRDTQRYWLDKMRVKGYAACVGYGHQHAIELIKRYLNGEKI